MHQKYSLHRYTGEGLQYIRLLHDLRIVSCHMDQRYYIELTNILMITNKNEFTQRIKCQTP